LGLVIIQKFVELIEGLVFVGRGPGKGLRGLRLPVRLAPGTSVVQENGS
jgi:hypothetical protein